MPMIFMTMSSNSARLYVHNAINCQCMNYSLATLFLQDWAVRLQALESCQLAVMHHDSCQHSCSLPVFSKLAILKGDSIFNGLCS